MNKWLVCLTVFALLLAAGCMGQAEKETEEKQMQAQYHVITPQEAKQIMEKEEAVVLDVRTEEEYRAQRIPGALLIPNEEISNIRPQELDDPDEMILIYCRSGHRSRAAAEKLVSMGYINVYDFGGIMDWPYEKE